MVEVERGQYRNYTDVEEHFLYVLADQDFDIQKAEATLMESKDE